MPSLSHQLSTNRVALMATRRLLPALGVIVAMAATLPAVAAASLTVKAVGRPEVRASAAAATVSSGLTPADLRSAYSLPKRGPSKQLIAVVVPYDYSQLATDLAAYSSEFSLTPCTTNNGCLRKLNQAGNGSPLPAPDPTGGTWNTEAALSSQVIHAVCPNCPLLVVEANSTANADLSAAVYVAAQAGAKVIDTTFVPPEDQSQLQYAGSYANPHAIVVSATGDSGWTGGGSFPASLPTVIAVGGTHLNLNRQHGYKSETVWNTANGATTSACSQYFSAPGWQSTLAKATGCGTMRTTADISAVADPGAVVHIAKSGNSGGPWFEVGGTSLSAPVIAGMVGLAGGGDGSAAQRLYDRARLAPGVFHDVTSGDNASLCDVPICSARRGFDGPTGLGTPHGLGAFTPLAQILDVHHPGITVTVTRSRLHVDRQGRARARLRNRNPFPVGVVVSLSSQKRLRVNGRLQTVTFATGQISLRTNSNQTLTLQTRRQYRALLAARRTVPVKLTLRLSDPANQSVTVTQRFALLAP
jgi:hypothetical protein